MCEILSTILKGCKGCKGGNAPVPGTTAVKALCGASRWQSLPPTLEDEYYFPSLITTKVSSYNTVLARRTLRTVLGKFSGKSSSQEKKLVEKTTPLDVVL